MDAKKTVRDYYSAEQLRKRDGEGFARDFRLAPTEIDVEKRTVPLSFSSEEPVLRHTFRGEPFYEVLDHSTVDMRDMQDGAPLLYGHDRRDHLGTVLKAAIGPDKKGRALVKFSRSKFAEEKFQDVQDGILTKTSVGYDLNDAEPVEDGEREGIPVIRFRNWRPYEATLCPLPADNTVGVGRSATTETTTTNTISIKMSATPPDAPPVAPVADLTAERQRIKDINSAAKTQLERHPQHADAIRQLASKCAETGDTIEAFNRTMLNDILATKQTLAPVRQDPNAATLGLDRKDVRRFSVMRAARLVMENKPLDGLERECHDELTKRLDRQAKGFFIPDDIMADRRSHKRALTAGVPADGGYTVGQELMTSEFETFLRNNAVVMKLGGRVISGLVGDVTIPRQLTGTTAYWVSETGSITASQPTFGQIVAKPRRIGTSVPYTKQFMAQTSLDAESFVITDSDQSTAVDLDRVALRGVGGVEPLGIANLAAGDRSTSVTFGAAPTWPKYLEFFSSVAANNAIVGAPAYVASVASAVKAMSTAKFANTSIPIWESGPMNTGNVGPFRAEWTTQLLTSATPVANMVIFGDFSQCLFLEWAGRDVVIDPFSGKKEGTVEITIQRLMDVVIRRGKSFAISADSGAQ